MKTALVVHGLQRVGKNFFFESYMQIYGNYGQVIDQDALEDKYNDCFSRKLFLVADEVIARQEMYHVKNKLKGMISGTRIRINPKNVKSYWETNHCNIIFLSNENHAARARARRWTVRGAVDPAETGRGFLQARGGRGRRPAGCRHSTTACSSANSATSARTPRRR
ncbi:MAG: DUF5906 domain-containing protein [Comamonadaceae bacterium]|nr:DUF5906 domain-containing protein [Comamonadaceae bacterium]